MVYIISRAPSLNGKNIYSTIVLYCFKHHFVHDDDDDDDDDDVAAAVTKEVPNIMTTNPRIKETC